MSRGSNAPHKHNPRTARAFALIVVPRTGTDNESVDEKKVQTR
jgi:hypothetical protein